MKFVNKKKKEEKIEEHTVVVVGKNLMICYHVFQFKCVNLTWCDTRRGAWELAHLAVRQQAAVRVRAGPTVPRLSRRVGLWQPPQGREGDQSAPPRCRPPLSPESSSRARAGPRRPELLQLWGEVLVGCAGLFFLLPSLLRVCSSSLSLRSGSRLWGDGGRCFFIFCSLPLLLLAGIRREEGTDVVLLLLLKL